MLNRRAKASFYAVAGSLMWLNGRIYRRWRAPRTSGCWKAQLGPGQERYLKGWINVDANPFTAKCDVWADLRNPLPFRDNTLSAVYSHHVVEHLPKLSKHFAEVFRALAPCGVYRVGGPNGDAAIQKFLEGATGWFSDFPDQRRSIGGRLENFIFCRQEHLTILTYSYLKELMTDVGFIEIKEHLPSAETGYPALFGECLALEHETDMDCPHTLVVEGQKAGGDQ